MKRAPLLVALVLGVIAVAIWGFVLVISHAFLIYNEPLDPEAANYRLLVQIKWFPVSCLAALALGALVQRWLRWAPVPAVLLPGLLLVVSVVGAVQRSRLDWDHFARPIDQAYIESCANGSPADVDRLLAEGAALEACGEHGLNPLFAAYIGHNRATFIHLLGLGVDPNRLPHGSTHYHVAVKIVGNLSPGSREEWFLQTLLDRGLDPNLDGDGSSLLNAAAKSYHLPLLQMLLDRGADPQRIDPQGFSALGMAVMMGKWRNARLLAPRSPRQAWLEAAAFLYDQDARRNRTDLDDSDRRWVRDFIVRQGIDLEQAHLDRMAAIEARDKAAGF